MVKTMSQNHQLILILDFGAKNNQLVARCVREMKVYCEVHPCNMPLEQIQLKKPIGVILIGGAGFQGGAESQKCSDAVKGLGIPVYTVASGQESDLQSLKSFLFGTCGAAGSWTMEDYAKLSVETVRQQVGDGKVLLALSGGVDSSVVAALLSEAVGDRLTCIFVDHGLMRKNEGDEVQAAFSGRGLNLIRIDAESRFLKKLEGVTDPEHKRKIIGEEFIRVFEEEAKKIGAVDFLAQGTIYPDIIESGVGGAGVVKSHHNVGGLPDAIDFKELIEPLRMLFKDEVRALGKALRLPDYLINRQPFPGPGLGVRVIGEITKEKLEILRDADAIFREEISNGGLDREISQYFAILTGMRSVGAVNDTRTYDYTLALRGVVTTDFMTAEFAKIPWELLEKASSRIVREVRNINRVVYDVTSKPPATIEWE